MATTILSIPAEMQKAIAEHIENDEDILQLRQTCRELCAASHDTFVQRYFTTQTVLYTKQGLDHLHKISAQPHLVGRLKEVTFKTLVPRTIDDARPHPIEALKYLYFSQKVLKATAFDGSEVALLTQILDNFSVAGSEPCFALLEYRAHPDARLAKIPGLSKMSSVLLSRFTKLGLVSSGSFRSQDRCDYCALTALTIASAASNFPLTELHFTNYGPSIFSRGAELPDDTISKSWRHLKTLSIPLQERQYWPQTDAQLPRFVRFAPALESLTLYFQCGNENEEREHALRLVHSATTGHRLRSIQIHGYITSDASSKDLMVFPGNHRETLKDLVISSVTWPTEDSVYDFIKFISDSFDLSTVLIEYISIDMCNFIENALIDYNGEAVFKFEDGETNAKELRGLCERTFFEPFDDITDSDAESEDEEDEEDEAYRNGLYERLDDGREIPSGSDLEGDDEYDSEEDGGMFDMDEEDEGEEYDGGFQDTFDFSASAEGGSQELYNFGGMAPLGGEEDHQQTLEDWF